MTGRLINPFIILSVGLMACGALVATAQRAGDSVTGAPKSDVAAGRLLLPVRAYQQTTSYTCGPAVLITLLRFYQQDGEEMRIAREAKCSPAKGTSPENMVAWLREHNFDVTWGENGSLDLLRANLERGEPTIVEWIDWGG